MNWQYWIESQIDLNPDHIRLFLDIGSKKMKHLPTRTFPNQSQNQQTNSAVNIKLIIDTSHIIQQSTRYLTNLLTFIKLMSLSNCWSDPDLSQCHTGIKLVKLVIFPFNYFHNDSLQSGRKLSDRFLQRRNF